MLQRRASSVLFSVFVLGCASTLSAQVGLPHGLAPEERSLIRPYRDSRASNGRGIPTPPPFAVRTMAEWEEVQSLVITWTSFPGILKQIVRHAIGECEVIIACEDQAEVLAYLQNEEFGGPIEDLSRVTYLAAPFNSIWARDYFAENIYANEVDSLLLLDWIYNRPRPDDDELSDAVGAAKDVVVYSTTQAPYDLVHTGGNFMCDGAATAFSSELVLDENGADGEFNQTIRDEAGVDQVMQQFMGIDRYIKMATLPFDGIHHIDMHMKLLDEETLLVGQFPTGQSDGPQLEQNISAVLAQEDSHFGDPYRLVRIPMPPSVSGNFPPDASYRTYANNVFINGTLLVPTYRTEYDTTALRILREELPGYNVVGIDCDSEQNIIGQSGAIHCITKTIGVADPLLIRHQRLADTYETINDYPVSAYLRHRSGIAFATLYWTTDTASGFASVPMTDQGAGNWSASIPAQSADSDVFYYVQGISNSGKVQVRPLVAPAGWWHFRVLDISAAIPDARGPVIAELFPNPTSSILVVTVPDAADERVDVVLQDALGRTVQHLYSGTLPADHRVMVDISALPEAPYLLVVTNKYGRSAQRVIKR